jgi:hypothetical protein
MTPLNPDPIREQLTASAALFAGLRKRFAQPGVTRGGHERIGFTPIYARLAGTHATALHGEAARYIVESSFSPDQLIRVQATLVLLRRAVNGELDGRDFAARVVDHYLRETRPAFLAALLRASEATLDVLLTAHPDQAVVLDAIFRVAGSEGMRDLICFFCAHLLEQTIAGATEPFPDLTAFTDVHERVVRDNQGQPSTTRYEVWCPGTDLAKLIDSHVRRAAATLVQEHKVDFALSTREEAQLLPTRLPAYLTAHVHVRAAAICAQYGVTLV